jgi:hypothetical protein
VTFTEGDRSTVEIGQSLSQLNYEIKTNNLHSAGR